MRINVPALGDIFSVTTVETVQALLLLVCPNILSLMKGNCCTKCITASRLLYVPWSRLKICSGHWDARGITESPRQSRATEDLVGYILSGGVHLTCVMSTDLVNSAVPLAA